jgi:ParB family protein of integrating conjugative element (PFGI_1 class)
MNWPEATAAARPDRVRRRRRLARQAHAGRHLKFTKAGCAAIYTSSTASDHRAALNARAQIRRAEREARSQAQGAAMAEITSQQMAGKLLAAGFERSGPSATALSDPIADTPMVVTLDQLRPYDHDPRKKRNPAYEEIKASIRERGLDAAPAITRRPGEDHYIIRNGGNTRLAILRELVGDQGRTLFPHIVPVPPVARARRDRRADRASCRERTARWPHVHRARLGVEKRASSTSRKAATLSQSELARRLAADGFPVQQSHISRMADAVRYLLPAIPTVLYGGLGRHQVERLSVMRACERTWEHYAKAAHWFRTSTSSFRRCCRSSTPGRRVLPQRVQDELIGQMAELLGIDYDVLAGHDRIRKPPARAGQRPDAASTPPALPEPGAIARPPADTAPPATRPTATPSTGERCGCQAIRAASPAADGDLLQSTSSRRHRRPNG